MKAIFIDAENHKVSLVNNKGQLEDKYLLLKVNMVEIGKYYTNGDTLYVDEEGLINGTDFGFILDGKRFMGNGVIYGTDRMSPEDPADAVTPINDLKIKFFKVKLP